MKIWFLSRKDSKSLKFTQITLKYTEDHANHHHNLKIAYNNYGKEQNGQNI